MAEDNEKKVAGKMNFEELENVAGGWCSFWSTSKPTLQKNQTLEGDPDVSGGYTIITNYGNGNIGKATYDKKHNYIGGGIAVCNNGTTR